MYFTQGQGSASSLLKELEKVRLSVKTWGDVTLTHSVRWDDRPGWMQWARQTWCSACDWCGKTWEEVCAAETTELRGRYHPRLSTVRALEDEDIPCDEGTGQPVDRGYEMDYALEFIGGIRLTMMEFIAKVTKSRNDDLTEADRTAAACETECETLAGCDDDLVPRVQGKECCGSAEPTRK